MRWSLATAVVLLVVNVVFIEITRPRGPFGEGDERMVLLDNAINYLFAELFQGTLALFLTLIAAIVSTTFKASREARSSIFLPVALLLIYGLAIACAIILGGRTPDFALLLRLGVPIVGLSWVALVLAIQFRRRVTARIAVGPVQELA